MAVPGPSLKLGCFAHGQTPPSRPPSGCSRMGHGCPASRPTAGPEWGSQGHPFSSSAGICEAQTMCVRCCASLRGHGPVEQPDAETLRDSEVEWRLGPRRARGSQSVSAGTPLSLSQRSFLFPFVQRPLLSSPTASLRTAKPSPSIPCSCSISSSVG